jgi:hypothetical protein
MQKVQVSGMCFKIVLHFGEKPATKNRWNETSKQVQQRTAATKNRKSTYLVIGETSSLTTLFELARKGLCIVAITILLTECFQMQDT